MVEEIDKDRFFLDQRTYTKFSQLNWKLLDHIKVLRAMTDVPDIDAETRKLGRSEVGQVQQFSESFVDAARQYMNRTYKLKVEKVV